MTNTTAPNQFHARPFNRWARLTNGIMVALCIVGAGVAILALFAIFGQVLYEGISSLNWDFFTQLPGSPDARIGMANCILGTVILIAMSSLIGVPMGMLCGIYLAEYGRKNWFTSSVRLFVDVLAGVPSIVIGILAYELIVRPMGNFSGVAGGMALAFIMAPIVARTTEEMLRLVPASQREASVGVGASRFQTLFKVILPAASAGIITGVMLAIARVAGETAPLMFTALGNDQWVTNPTKPFPSLTLQIFKYATSAEPHWQQMAWTGMLVLISIILILNASVRYVSRQKKGQVS
jgi:phosphate transport system permease protein